MGTFREELKNILKMDRATNKSSILAWAKKWFVQDDAKYLYEQIVSGHLDNLTEKDRLYKINDYLYTINYDTLDYEVGDKFMKEYFMPKSGCSSIRYGNLHGRNYDWLYDDKVEVVVRVSGNKDRYKSIGICSTVPGLTKGAVENKLELDNYKAIPFMIVDGINEKGVCCNINVVPSGDKGVTTGTHPELSNSVCQLMLPRYILDHYATAKEAAEDLRDNVNIYAPQSALLPYEIHVMVSDPNETYIIEFIENVCIIKKVGSNELYPAIMSNFYITDVTTDSNGLVTINRDGLDNESGITSNGSGLERHNIMANWIQDGGEDIFDLMTNQIKYTNAFTMSESDDYWYTEFVEAPIAEGSTTLTTCTSTTQDYAYAVSVAKDRFQHRDRSNPQTWQTIHSSIYNLEDKSLTLVNQENPDNKIILYL